MLLGVEEGCSSVTHTQHTFLLRASSRPLFWEKKKKKPVPSSLALKGNRILNKKVLFHRSQIWGVAGLVLGDVALEQLLVVLGVCASSLSERAKG